MKEPVEVVAAVIRNKGRFLCVQRAEHRHPYLSGKFEFPGGKCESGESQEQALIREIREELNLSIRPVKLLLSVDHTYPDFRILLHAWICDCPTRELELREHQTARWLKCGELHQLDWAAADVPIVSRLQAEADEF